MDQYPGSIVFLLSLDEEPKPTVIIHRDGMLEPANPNLRLEEVKVVLEMEDDWIDITPAQYQAMVQLARLALHQQPLARIVFEGGASPWGLDYLPHYNPAWDSVADGMRIRPTKSQKFFMRKKPMHPAVRRTKAEYR